MQHNGKKSLFLHSIILSFKWIRAGRMVYIPFLYTF